MQGIAVFDRLADEYDSWFDRHRAPYLAEVETLRRLLPQGGVGIEIGAGTGRFGLPLGAALGIEPSRAMAAIAHARGLTTVQAYGEQLPVANGYFDFALLVTVICFVVDVPTLLRETSRILRPGGREVRPGLAGLQGQGEALAIEMHLPATRETEAHMPSDRLLGRQAAVG